MSLFLGFPRTRGIDRGDWLCRGDPQRFPRTRGDRPLEITVSPTPTPVPPHARG